MINKDIDKLDIASSAYVGPAAVLMGEVKIEEDCSVWPGAVLRGDFEPVTVGARSNIQENSVLHTDTGYPLTIGREVTVGHGCILHGCTIRDGALVGMGSIVLDGAVLEEGCLLGAGSLVSGGTVIPAGMLAFGRPAKVIRPLKPEEKEKIQHGVQEYVRLKNSRL